MTVSRRPSTTKAYHATCCLYAQSARPMLRSGLAALMVATLFSALLGCDDSTKHLTDDQTQAKSANNNPATGAESTVTTTPVTDTTSSVPDTVQDNSQTIPSTPSMQNSLQIDWAQVDSQITPVDADGFDYPFKLYSKAVESYATFFKVTPKQAQHNLTVGTASNEPLSRLLDQLGSQYLAHELSNGEDVKLVVHTTANVAPSHYDYVIADDFAHGLILPIEIVPIDVATGDTPPADLNSGNSEPSNSEASNSEASDI